MRRKRSIRQKAKDGPRASAGAARGRPATPRGHGCTPAGSLVPTSEEEPVRDLNHDFKAALPA